MERTEGVSHVREPETIDTTPMQSVSIVAIDGDNGAGKSHLGEELADRLGGEHVEVDEFLLGNGAAYLQQLDKAQLAARLEAVQRRPAIVEGILLLDVFDALRIRSDYLIFAKSFINGAREQERYLLPAANLPRSRTPREIAEYYRRRKPWLEADLIVTLHTSIGR